MRRETDQRKLECFMTALGERVCGPGAIYLRGDATALLYGWRAATIDIDIKPDPEPPGLFEAIAAMKDELDVNVELASPRELRRYFDEIAPLLVRYPAIDPASFESAVAAFCAEVAREGEA